MSDPKMIQRVVERFQTVYTLEDEPRSGRPHTLSDDDRTELREHPTTGCVSGDWGRAVPTKPMIIKILH